MYSCSQFCQFMRQFFWSMWCGLESWMRLHSAGRGARPEIPRRPHSCFKGERGAGGRILALDWSILVLLHFFFFFLHGFWSSMPFVYDLPLQQDSLEFLTAWQLRFKTAKAEAACLLRARPRIDRTSFLPHPVGRSQSQSQSRFREKEIESTSRW